MHAPLSAADNALLNCIREHRKSRSSMLTNQTVRLPGSLSAALRLALLGLDGEAAAGWKLGGTNAATRESFAVSVPYFGPLKAKEVLSSGSNLSLSKFIAPKAEPEVCVAFKETFCASRRRRSEATLLEHLDWVALGVEIPDCVFADVKAIGVRALVADRCAAGALVLGTRRSPDMLEAWRCETVSLSIAGEPPVVGRVDALLGGVLGAMSDALIEFGRHDIDLPAGVIFATGGLCRAQALRAGEAVVRLGSDVVRFTVLDGEPAERGIHEG